MALTWIMMVINDLPNKTGNFRKIDNLVHYLVVHCRPNGTVFICNGFNCRNDVNGGSQYEYKIELKMHVCNFKNQLLR